MSVFSDESLTGGIIDRAGLQAAIHTIKEMAEEPSELRAIVLVVDAADRLARDMLVSLTIRHEIEKAGGRIEFANGTPVSETPEGRLFANVLAAFAAYERDRVRYATSRGMKRRQANGEWFGKPPVGFMIDPKCSTRLVVCHQENEAIMMARSMRGRKCSWKYIAEYLNEHHGQFRGAPWKADTIRKSLAREKKQ
jgi:DNA invertase Pin-like site-specific DNA recombinase